MINSHFIKSSKLVECENENSVFYAKLFLPLLIVGHKFYVQRNT